MRRFERSRWRAFMPFRGLLNAHLVGLHTRSVIPSRLLSARGFWDKHADPCSGEALQRACERHVSVLIDLSQHDAPALLVALTSLVAVERSVRGSGAFVFAKVAALAQCTSWRQHLSVDQANVVRWWVDERDFRYPGLDTIRMGDDPSVIWGWHLAGPPSVRSAWHSARKLPAPKCLILDLEPVAGGARPLRLDQLLRRAIGLLAFGMFNELWVRSDFAEGWILEFMEQEKLRG